MDLLRHLDFFVAVAEEGHFGRAAERLGMTQPPVSQGVQRLERRLGVELFSRGSRGVGLTPAGTSLLPQAYALLASASEFVASAGRLRDRAVRVGVIGQISAFHLAAMVSSSPRALAVTTASTVELVEAVASGQLDCAVVHHPALVNALECGPVIKVPSWFLVPAGREDLRGLSCATAPRSHGTAAFDLLADSLRAAGLDPDFIPAADDREVVAAVAAGQAFGLTTDPPPAGTWCIPTPRRRVRLARAARMALAIVRSPLRCGSGPHVISQQIRSVFQDAGTDGWLHAVPLVPSPTREIDVGADDQVVMASVYKLPLLVALCRQFDSGTIDPLGTVRINPGSCTPGPTGIATFLDPVTLSWRDLAASMITVSDSAAADMLLGRVGLPALQKTLLDLALPHTRIIGGTADIDAILMRETGTSSASQALALLADNDMARTVSAYDPAYTSATTPREMTKLLSLIWSGSAASPAQCQFMRQLLGKQIWQHRIRAGFPYAGVQVAGKTGTIGAIRNEVSVVTFPGEVPIAVAIFTFAARSDLALPAVDAAIASAARIAVTDLRSGRL